MPTKYPAKQNKMKISQLLKYNKKPDLYTPGTAVMWTDEHISKQLLEVHLNTEIDLASRKKSSIEKTVNWILDKTKKQQLNILDLGCGPGLYSEILAQKGHNVTGVDFSKNSIEYARKQADKKHLDIHYINQNYLKLELNENQFDLIIIIYTDYCVLNPNERSQFLTNIRKWLKPGGTFIFDANSDKNLEKKVSPNSWKIAENGFWRNEPYLALSASFLYEKEKVILYQHIVTNDNGNAKIYRFYTHFFSENELAKELTENGFTEFNFYNNVLPESDLWNGENIIFCVVRN